MAVYYACSYTNICFIHFWNIIMEYFLIGFLTAFGWWAAGKVTTEIDEYLEPTTIIEEEVNTSVEREGAYQ